MAELTTNLKALVGYMKKSDQHSAYGFDLILKREDPEIFFDELRDAGLFDPDRNPRPRPVESNEGFFRIPYWTALKYLTHVAKISGGHPNADLGQKVMSVVRSIMQHSAPEGPIDNYHTFSELAEIFGSVPTTCVSLEDIDFVQTFLRTQWNNSVVVPKLDRAMQHFLSSELTQDHEKATLLLEHVTELRDAEDSDRPMRTSTTLADAYWLEQLLAHNAVRLGEVASPPALNCLRQRLCRLFGDEYLATHSWLKRAAIEDHEQNHDWDHVTNAFINATRDALEAWTREAPLPARDYVGNMVTDEAQIVRRIAIHVVRVQWTTLREVFEGSVDARWFDVGHLHEMYLLLRERYGDLPAPIQSRIRNVISDLTNGKEEGSDEFERAQYRQRNWLHPIRGLGDKWVDMEHARLTGIFGPIREFPDLLSYHSTFWGSDSSPYSEDELTAFAEDRSLIARVDSYVPPKGERGHSLKSLSDELILAIQKSPEKFLWPLHDDIGFSRATQYGLLQGFAKFIDTFKDRDPSPALRAILDVLLPYLVRLVSEETFWAEAVEEEGDFVPTKDWIPPVVVEVAKKLVANDRIELTTNEFRLLLDVVLAVKGNTEGIEMGDDPMTSAINNPRGMAVDALLQLVLRVCRDADAATGDHRDAWLSFRPHLDDEVEGCIHGRRLEASTLFAAFLAQLLYVDDGWVEANAQRLFPFDQPNNFSCAVAGLSFANANTRVYRILRSADVPCLALGMDGISGSARERLIERIALAYMWGEETLSSPVLVEMFSDRRLADLTELISTISRWDDAELEDDQIDRAKLIARVAVEFGLEDRDSRTNLLAAASKLIGFFPDPTEQDMEWLLEVTPFAHVMHGDDDFLEALEKMAARDPAKALALFEIFINGYEVVHDFRGRLATIVRQLDAAGLHLQALTLVDRIVKKGAGASWVELYNDLVARRDTDSGNSA